MQQAQQFAKMAGFGHNLKLVLYLQSQCLAESLGFLNPPLLQAAKRYNSLLRFVIQVQVLMESSGLKIKTLRII